MSLRDGRAVAIRPADASDRSALRAFFAKLSAATVKLRFHFAFRELPERLLNLLTAIAQPGSTILVAEPATSPGTFVGEARYVRMNDAPEVAEAAIVVADGWHRIGLGKLLLGRLLAHARGAGVRKLIAHVSRENEAIVHLLRSFGARSVPGSAVGGDVQMRIELS